MRVWPTLLAGSLGLAACSPSPTRGVPLLPDQTLRLTSAFSFSSAGVASGALALAALHVVYDPLAPNWEIEESRLGDDTFRLSLRMKRYHTGGAGESMAALRRRVSQLQQELGYGGYQLLEFSEGIESETLGARRVAAGTIKLVQHLPAQAVALPVSPSSIQTEKIGSCANSFVIDPC